MDRPRRFPDDCVIRLADEGDLKDVAQWLHEEQEALRDDYMVSLVAEYHGRPVAVLRGWLGHPYGHIAELRGDMALSVRRRYLAGLWLFRTFEGLLDHVGAKGWTATAEECNIPIQHFLLRQGATQHPDRHMAFIRRWR